MIAGHVRPTHIHLIVHAEEAPDAVLQELKSAGTEALRLLGSPRRKHWVRGGSKRYLWTANSVSAAMDYVLNGQGDAMETYCLPAAQLASLLQGL